MTKVAFLACLIALIGFPLAAPAQENYTEGSVARVILLDVKPGKLNELLADFAKNLKPTYEEFKKQGLIEGYQFALNVTTASADDWDVSIRLTYKSMAALDGLTAKTDPITLKQYGSKDARQAVMDQRLTLATAVGSRLIREITLK